MKSRPSRAALLGALAAALCLAGCSNDAKNQVTQSTQQRDPEMAKPASSQGHNGTVRDIPESKPFTPGPDYQPPPALQQQGGAQAQLVQTGSGAMAPRAGTGMVGAVGGSGPQAAPAGGQGSGGTDAQAQPGRAGGKPAQGKAAAGARKK